jgi:hypothetical protein
MSLKIISTRKALFSGARSAMRMSRQSQREGDTSEANRHRERAAGYLLTRKHLQPITHKENTHVHSEA